ncbi:hypothetical protein Afil01_46290 [Actinorhabdospora filicis]|uniref:Low molecular weight protein antigen 6 PH domain-containing protein n=1 Tax=Actinorhabdospora filicis TaxID=1785913 RepID=A0A9W6W4Z8_9ACTN|nr:PH domain-containing protein [Actinorhabdospora filicis]GLZ79822.1 hypothetical protein Afil01_46290 [Actinorhabdospora filicis]
MTVISVAKAGIRFRHSGGMWIAAVLFFISGLPLAMSSWYLAPILLVPVGAAVWAWRSGVDASSNGLRVRGLVGSRRVTWEQVEGFGAGRRDTFAVLRDGTRLPLPAVRRADLPRLIAAGGTELVLAETGDDAGETAAE